MKASDARNLADNGSLDKLISGYLKSIYSSIKKGATSGFYECKYPLDEENEDLAISLVFIRNRLENEGYKTDIVYNNEYDRTYLLISWK